MAGLTWQGFLSFWLGLEEGCREQRERNVLYKRDIPFSISAFKDNEENYFLINTQNICFL